MNEPFVFRKALYLVEATGNRARNLDEFLRTVTLVSPESIQYHMHREYLNFRFVEPEWPNDFAYWAAKILGDEVLAEKLAALRVFNYRSLEALQLDLARIVASHLLEVPVSALEVVPPGRDFIFQSARAVVMNCGREARTLEEFERGLSEVEASSIYFHLFETRFSGGSGHMHDFARWAGAALGNPRLAEKLTAFDPYMFSLEGARKAMLRIVAAATGEEREELR